MRRLLLETPTFTWPCNAFMDAAARTLEERHCQEFLKCLKIVTTGGQTVTLDNKDSQKILVHSMHRIADTACKLYFIQKDSVSPPGGIFLQTVMKLNEIEMPNIGEVETMDPELAEAHNAVSAMCAFLEKLRHLDATLTMYTDLGASPQDRVERDKQLKIISSIKLQSMITPDCQFTEHERKVSAAVVAEVRATAQRHMDAHHQIYVTQGVNLIITKLDRVSQMAGGHQANNSDHWHRLLPKGDPADQPLAWEQLEPIAQDSLGRVNKDELIGAIFQLHQEKLNLEARCGFFESKPEQPLMKKVDEALSMARHNCSIRIC